MTNPEKATYIRFCAPVQEKSVKELMHAIQQELNQGVNRFVILISSPGGNVFWGLTAYNFLKGVPAEIETYNFGTVDSVAIILYCAGKKRYSVQHARFLMHGVGFTIPKETRFEMKQLDERTKCLRIDTENIAGIIAENTRKSEEEVISAMYEGTALNPEQAVEMGLVHEIKESLFERGAKIISIS